MANQVELKQVIRACLQDFESKPYVKVGVSNHHIHLSREDMDILFGPGVELTPIKDLLPGQYASAEVVDVAGPKGTIKKMRILGPLRSTTQVEVSLTDTFILGLQVPIRESGKLDGAATVTISNPLTGASIERACAIVALRHAHLTPEFAARFGLKDKQFASLEFSGERKVLFDQVLLRVSKDFNNEIHIDLDEANAGAIKNDDLGLIITGRQ
jgi:putative phosphotransacetylase